MKRILTAALILPFSISGLLTTGCTYTSIEQESSGKPRSEIPKEKPVRVPMAAE